MRRGLPRDFLQYMGVQHSDTSHIASTQFTEKATAASIKRAKFEDQAKELADEVMRRIPDMLDVGCDQVPRGSNGKANPTECAGGCEPPAR